MCYNIWITLELCHPKLGSISQKSQPVTAVKTLTAAKIVRIAKSGDTERVGIRSIGT